MKQKKIMEIVDLGRIELPPAQCECAVMPLYYRPLFHVKHPILHSGCRESNSVCLLPKQVYHHHTPARKLHCFTWNTCISYSSTILSITRIYAFFFIKSIRHTATSTSNSLSSGTFLSRRNVRIARDILFCFHV